MAFALPVEGEAGPFAGGALARATTCGPGETAAGVAGRLAPGNDRVLVVDDHGIVLGAADRSALDGADRGATVEGVMQLSPTTVRPSVELGDLVDAEEATVVTDPDGRLLGVVEPGDAGASGLGELGSAFLDLAHAVGDHFEGGDPSEEEVRVFLRDRLIAEGRSAEAADEFLGAMDGSGPESGSAPGR